MTVLKNILKLLLMHAISKELTLIIQAISKKLTLIIQAISEKLTLIIQAISKKLALIIQAISKKLALFLDVGHSPNIVINKRAASEKNINTFLGSGSSID